ncbi:MAG: Gfo/Idh/MocA family oxidoreductase [Planctomycetia bacterium]
MSNPTSRRSFLGSLGAGAAAFGLATVAQGKEKPIPGFEDHGPKIQSNKKWEPVSDRKIRVGIAGYGYCRFGAAFGFQDHPNVEVVAVTDLFPDRCQNLAKACRCKKTYPSLEEMVKDDSIEAIFAATDAPAHARHAIEAMKHGKHVATAVPAVFGSLEEADELLETVKKTGQKYMLFETSYFRHNCCAMRAIYEAGGFGKLVYSEGEYFHYHASKKPTPSYKDWRKGMPPLWYATHSTAYYVGVTGGQFTSVSALGTPGHLPYYKENQYNNHFGSEFGLYTTTDGSVSRMLTSMNARQRCSETGRVMGRHGAYIDNKYTGLTPKEKLPELVQPPLPPGVKPGGHGGSHGRLCDEFVTAILEDRTPAVDVTKALAMSVAGVVAHQSALKDGERLKIPQYHL